MNSEALCLRAKTEKKRKKQIKSGRETRPEVLYFFFGIHTANVVWLADRIEQRALLAAASLGVKTLDDNPYVSF